MPDYVPTSLDNLAPWLTNLKGRITADGPALGRSAAQIADDILLIDSLLTLVTAARQKEHDWLEARGAAQTGRTATLPLIRDVINQYKTLPGWSEGQDDAWEVSSQNKSYNMDTHHPDITAKSFPGMVVIRGKKPGFTSVNLRMRRKGQPWMVIGNKIAHFPFNDTTAPLVPGQPEEREYQAIGVVGDHEAGQPSPIVTAIFN